MKERDMNSIDRCTGECCKAFVLNNYTKEELQYSYDQLKLPLEMRWVDPPGRIVIPVEIKIWWPWMIYLGNYDKHPITGKEYPEGYDFFTCSQLLPNGDCAVYEQRPHFCRGYGVTIDCEHDCCTWHSGRAAREKLKKEYQAKYEVKDGVACDSLEKVK